MQSKGKIQGMQKTKVDLPSQIDRNPTAVICWKFRHLDGTRGASHFLLDLENLRPVNSRFRMFNILIKQLQGFTPDVIVY